MDERDPRDESTRHEGGARIVENPAARMRLWVAHSLDFRHPQQIDHQTEPLSFSTTTAHFLVRSAVEVEPPQKAPAVVERQFQDVILGLVRIRNTYGIGVRVYVERQGRKVVEAVISPGSVLVLDRRVLSFDDGF